MKKVRAVVVVLLLLTLSAASRGQSNSSVAVATIKVTASLPDALQGVAYSALLQANGLHAGAHWRLAEGSLATGLELDAENGLVHGTPQASGAFKFSLQVTDTAHNEATQIWSLSLQVAPREVSAAATSQSSAPPSPVAVVENGGVVLACPLTMVAASPGSAKTAASATSLGMNASGVDTLQASCLRLPDSFASLPYEVSAASPAAAGRLLDQAAFGPTVTDLQHVQQVGLAGYLLEQFAVPQTVFPQFNGDIAAPCDGPDTCWAADWWKAAVTAPDQLRQRVAFALSHIFVTSTLEVGGYAMVPYYNLLAADAFSNWRTLMQDVTLSPVMGNYLNMVNSAKAPAGQMVNENFARENLQLFNIGTVQLNFDGSARTDAQGHSLPAYNQDQVQAFARAFTGWTFASRWGQTLQDFQPDPKDVSTYVHPMVPIESLHDNGAKTLLSGVTLPPGQTAEQDLSDALDNIFQQGNLPPFIARQLIQQLVTSNPSPEYISRVVEAFINNGFGVRGDMRAVVSAILLDPEARFGDINPQYDGGHLREPLLYLANVLRALPYTPKDTVDPWGYWAVTWSTAAFGEAPMGSPSVFYFYAPSYKLPGTAQFAPEFGIENVASVSARKVLADQLIYGIIGNMSLNLAGDTDLMSRANNPGALADELSFLFLHSQMSDQMKQIIVNTITPLRDQGDPQQRVRVALNLVLTSSQYKIIH